MDLSQRCRGWTRSIKGHQHLEMISPLNLSLFLRLVLSNLIDFFVFHLSLNWTRIVVSSFESTRWWKHRLCGRRRSTIDTLHHCSPSLLLIVELNFLCPSTTNIFDASFLFNLEFLLFFRITILSLSLRSSLKWWAKGHCSSTFNESINVEISFSREERSKRSCGSQCGLIEFLRELWSFIYSDSFRSFVRKISTNRGVKQQIWLSLNWILF